MRWRWGLGVVVVAMTMGGGAPAKDYPLRVTISGVKPKYALGDSVALRAQATFGGPKAQLSYRWFASDGPGLPFDMDTSQQKISIPGEELVPGASYTVGV